MLNIKNLVLAVAAVGLGAVAINQVVASSGEVKERKVIYMKALEYSTQTHKPLLVIGTPKGKHPCGDITIDLSEDVLQECPIGGDVLDINDLDRFYPKKSYGSAVFMHVLEHLDDPELALRKALYVADRVYFAGPSWSSITSRVNSEHISMGWWLDFKQKMKCPTCSTKILYVSEVIHCEYCNQHMGLVDS